MPLTDKEKQEQKRQADEFKARVNDYIRTFCSEHGRRVLKDMRKANRHPFDPNPFSAMKNLGKLELIQEIEDLLTLGKSPQTLADMFPNPEDEGFIV